MKKICVALLCAIVCSAAAYAQKGQSAVGINLGYSIGLDEPKPKNFEIGAKYQYNVSDPIRLEAAFNYGLKNQHVSLIDYGVNVHYLFNLSESFKLYPLVGVGGLTAKIEGGDSKTTYMINAGVGGEYMLSEHLGLNLEVKYSYSKFSGDWDTSFSRIPVSIGVAYKF